MDATVAAWESLFRAQVTVMKQLRREFPDELTLNEYDLLFNLSTTPHGRAKLRDLTERLLVSQPSVSRLVDRLVQRGLVAKSVDPDDRRGALIAFTDLGRETYRRVAVLHAEAIRRVVGSALDDAQLEQLRGLTARLVASAD